jgi:hypothetical protein
MNTFPTQIALYDVDGHSGFPNFALAKLSAWHRHNGDVVTLNPLSISPRFSRAYLSKIFTFTPECRITTSFAARAEEVIRGGTGYDIRAALPPDIEAGEPDYALYPRFKHAFGFLTRGCPRRCPWCVVPQKEGDIRAYRDIETVLQGRRTAVLMDNNILATLDGHGGEQLRKIAVLGVSVDFNQGLDARLITPDAADLLARIKWLGNKGRAGFIRLACDTQAAVEPVAQAVRLLAARGVKPYRVFVYVLVQNVADAYERVKILRELGVVPFAQPYRAFAPDAPPPTQEQRNFARWTNNKAVFKTVDWPQYEQHTGGPNRQAWKEQKARAAQKGGAQ